MKRSRFSLWTYAIAAILLLTGGLSAASAAPAVVYSLATDADIQGKAIGANFESTAWFIRSGSPGLTIVDVKGVKGIKIIGRSQDWDCIDLKNLSSLPDGFEYTIKVTGRGIGGDKMKLSQPTGPYKTHISQDAAADGAFSLEKT